MAVKKILSKSKERKIAGVCGGIAEYFNVDPTVVRLGWILVTATTGVFPGVIGYILAAWVMPEG